MSDETRKVDPAALLAKVERAGLLALTPDEVLALEQAAARSTTVADRLAALATAPSPMEQVPAPPSAWPNLPTQSAGSPRTAPPLWRFARSGVAVAAALLLAVGLSYWDASVAARINPLVPDHSAEILSLETYGEQAPMVVTVGEQETFPVIWLTDSPGSES
jgi:anti-sigma factor RsiW